MTRPGADRMIRYDMPTWQVEGISLVHVAAWAPEPSPTMLQSAACEESSCPKHVSKLRCARLAIVTVLLAASFCAGLPQTARPRNT